MRFRMGPTATPHRPLRTQPSCYAGAPPHEEFSQMVRVAALLCLAILVTIGRHAEAAPTVDTFAIGGLAQPAEILVDEWGVPHIYAKTHYDAFVVQGFNAARDRLWQIDTWRRRGLGELSEVLGDAYIAQDRAARLFLYRGDLYPEWLAYGNDAKLIAQS